MSKKVIIDGRTLDGVTSIKAKLADADGYASFTDTSDATATASDIAATKTAYVDGVKITGTNTGVEPNDLDGIVDGTLTSFTMPSGKVTIKQYRFCQFTSLTYANLGAVQTVEQYAFDGCNNAECAPPNTITTVGQYAFRNLGRNKSGFEFNPVSPCAVATYGFNGARITKLSGTFTSLASYCFAACSWLTSVDITASTVSDYAFQNATAMTSLKISINGAVGAYAFYGCTKVATCEIDADSVITSLGNYAFSRFAGARTNASENIITLDLRKSTFTTVPQYGFGGDNASTSNRNQYMKILLPSTVTTVSSYAFRYVDNVDIYFNTKKPATLSATNCFSNATNFNLFVPFANINAYKTATNWTAQVSHIKGYAAAGTFAVGDTLPDLNAEGYELTWYSDKACTNEVTTVTDADAELYCLAGDEKLGYGITSIAAVGCTVSVTDSNGKSYTVGAGIRIGTVLTITGMPTTEGDIVYMFTVNGENFTSGDTFTITDADISITAIYWDGENLPILPTFADNSWTMIKEAFRTGLALQFWSVGDIKPVISKSGKTYHIRISDRTVGRYNIVGGGTTNGVLEFVECYNLNNKISWAINATAKESYWTGGGYALSDMANIYLQEIFNDLPDDLQAAMSEIELSEYSYTQPTPRAGTHKLFLPAETEVFANRHYSAEGTTGYPKYEQFEYYAAIKTADGSTCPERQKCDVGTTNTRYWWLRSPCSGDSSYFCGVNGGGSYSYISANYASGVSPCFAI